MSEVDHEPTGPFLAAALLCEQVLGEQSGVLSAIRIVDQVLVTASGTDVPQQMPVAGIAMKGLVMLKSGEARGRFVVTLRVESPAGVRQEVGQLSVQLQGGANGANLVMDLNLQVSMPGLHWIDVLLDGNLITRMPLDVVYQTMQTAGP
jgi:Family of unknown function (DUF6941)